MRTLSFSAHSLDLASCLCRLHYYRHRQGGRTSSRRSAALTQGIAGHAAIARWLSGKPQAEQDAVIERVFADSPPEPDFDGRPDYRTPAYLREALAQYKAEFPLDQWDIEEVEKDFDVVFDVVTLVSGEEIEIHWTGARDAVAVNRLDGLRYVIDKKFVSRDESAAYTAAKNSTSFKGYVWSYQQATSKPVAGVLMRRIVIRRPTKAAPLNVSIPLDPPILFQPERIEEWRAATLRRIAAIAELDPAQPGQWPQNEACCRTTFGCCDYLQVCLQPPGTSRDAILGSGAFKSSAERDNYDMED